MTGRRQLVDADAARAHVEALMAAGAEMKTIAAHPSEPHTPIKDTNVALQADLSHLPRPQQDRPTGLAPDTEPRYVHLLVDKWHQANVEAGPKPRATATARFRHSDAGKCARAVAFAALDLPPTNPMDMAGTWATSLGTLLHEAWQEAILDTYPDAEIEPKVSTIDGEGAGHIDAVFPDGRKVAFELKSVGGFAFKQAIGERSAAHGPKAEHITQCALNAVAVDADEMVIGYLSKEAISVGIAQRKGISELGRFCAEWTFTREQFEPIAAAEMMRVRGILALVDAGKLPARKFPSGELPDGAEIVDPSTGRWEVLDRASGALVDTGTFWACGYCPHQTRCAATGSGRVELAEVTL